MDRLLSDRRILVVEDEMIILMTLEDMLADLGCEAVASAATVEQAIALIEGQVFDAAILDVNLNGASSYSVADSLAARGVPFAFSTGNSVHDVDAGHGERVVLRKPYRNQDLVEVLRRLLPD